MRVINIAALCSTLSLRGVSSHFLAAAMRSRKGRVVCIETGGGLSIQCVRNKELSFENIHKKGPKQNNTVMVEAFSPWHLPAQGEPTIITTTTPPLPFFSPLNIGLLSSLSAL